MRLPALLAWLMDSQSSTQLDIQSPHNSLRLFLILIRRLVFSNPYLLAMIPR